jgi:hypothetical protein
MKTYITSVKTTHKHRKSEIIGPCGPCTFINLIDLKGSFELEKKLASSGRLKPLYMSDFTSFLLWAKKYKKDLEIYTSQIKTPEGTFRMAFKYEKIPKEKQKRIKEKVIKRRNKILEKNKDKINLFKGDFLKLIDKLLSEGKLVAFTVGTIQSKTKEIVGHFRVCYKKEKGIYFIKDSSKGHMKLTRAQMKRDIGLLDKISSKKEIIAYKNEP